MYATRQTAAGTIGARAQGARRSVSAAQRDRHPGDEEDLADLRRRLDGRRQQDHRRPPQRREPADAQGRPHGEADVAPRAEQEEQDRGEHHDRDERLRLAAVADLRPAQAQLVEARRAHERAVLDLHAAHPVGRVDADPAQRGRRDVDRRDEAVARVEPDVGLPRKPAPTANAAWRSKRSGGRRSTPGRTVSGSWATSTSSSRVRVARPATSAARGPRARRAPRRRRASMRATSGARAPPASRRSRTTCARRARARRPPRSPARATRRRRRRTPRRPAPSPASRPGRIVRDTSRARSRNWLPVDERAASRGRGAARRAGRRRPRRRPRTGRTAGACPARRRAPPAGRCRSRGPSSTAPALSDGSSSKNRSSVSSRLVSGPGGFDDDLLRVRRVEGEDHAPLVGRAGGAGASATTASASAQEARSPAAQRPIGQRPYATASADCRVEGDISSAGRSRRCFQAPSTLGGASMDADLDLLLTVVYCTADDFLPRSPHNARRTVTDAEIVTLASPRR